MKFRRQIALVLVVAGIILLFAVAVPAYMRGGAFHKARSFDDRTVSVANVMWSFCGDIQIETTDGDKIFFPGHTPFASYVSSNIWLDTIVLPAGSELHLHVIEEAQITPSWVSAGISPNEWEPGTWLQVEIVDHW